ncbi:MAG: tRNA threonylcarbamoyladenosine dehydratase [Oscillospiraceae bacterium]|nr:tRNA threonylcarbamoyladenosine dehydratase [Oscillospiraceae bacterium]
MTRQFERTALLIGQKNLDKLKNRRVAVFGIGGVGGHCAEALCRCGIGALDIFDGDVIDITNINRQLIASHRTVGHDKVEVMREHLIDINPELEIKTQKLFYLPETANCVNLSVYDYVIDAIDTITAKIELVCRCNTLSIPVISSMGAANKLDPAAFKVSDIHKTSVCPIARVMRRELRARNVSSLKVVYSTETPVKNEKLSSISFVPPVVGLIIASEVVKDLIK